MIFSADSRELALSAPVIPRFINPIKPMTKPIGLGDQVTLYDASAEYRAIRTDALSALDAIGQIDRASAEAEVTRFEEEFAVWGQVKHCVAVQSASAAFALALRALEVGTGDEDALGGGREHQADQVRRQVVERVLEALDELAIKDDHGLAGLLKLHHRDVGERAGRIDGNGEWLHWHEASLGV